MIINTSSENYSKTVTLNASFEGVYHVNPEHIIWNRIMIMEETIWRINTGTLNASFENQPETMNAAFETDWKSKTGEWMKFLQRFHLSEQESLLFQNICIHISSFQQHVSFIQKGEVDNQKLQKCS